MTSNQIDYWKFREQERHNLVTEGLERTNQAEVKRHNVQSENIGYMQASAAQLQAQVAQLRADIDQSYLRLASAKQHYEIVNLEAQSRNINAQAALNEEKATYQAMQNKTYAMYGMKQAMAEYYNTVTGSVLNAARSVGTGIDTVKTIVNGFISVAGMVS